MPNVTISGKTVGRKKPLFADFSVPFPPNAGGGGHLTLRQVIERVVKHELAAFRQRQVERKVFRALTARQIEEGVERGKIESGGSEVGVQPTDEQESVGAALQAFEDGLYLVAIDDQEQRSLDSQVYLKPDSRITFIRLTLLAGG